MSPRTRLIFEIAAVTWTAGMATFHVLSGAYQTAWWPLTFYHLSVPVLFSLLFWSFRRDMRAHHAGTLVVASPKLAAEVTLVVVSIFAWIGFVTYVVRRGLPDSPSLRWLVDTLFLAWLVWSGSAIWRARGYAFTLEPLEAKP